MNKAAIKRMTRRTEFYIFLVLILMIAVIGVISQGQLFEPTQIVTILRAMVVDGMFAMCSLVVMISGGFDLSFPAVSALSYSLATTICLNQGWCQTNPWMGFLLAAVIGAVIYYAVITLVLRLGLQSTDLKLLTALVVAVFLAVPYWKAQVFRKKQVTGGGGNA